MEPENTSPELLLDHVAVKIEYLSDLTLKIKTQAELIEKLSYDHECCDSENCRFCIAFNAWEQQ